MEGSVVVLGGGSWGTTIASIAADQCATTLWTRSADMAREISTGHTNERYLAGIALSANLHATSNLEEALIGSTAVLVAVPSHGMRAILQQAAQHVSPGTPVFSLAKGIEDGTALRMSQVVAEVVPQAIPGAVTGPNLAQEIALGQPAASLVACEDEASALLVQRALQSSRFRSYVSSDVVGCELAGATKNVLAIAVGIADGLGFGENTRALLIARGLAEMSRLGVALGGQAATFGGLAGVGDLVATATSDRSRNRMVGVQLGLGTTLSAITASMHMVAEGVKSAAPLVDIAHTANVEIPICEQVAAIVSGATTPAEALAVLMDRPARVE